jgi:signal transduction histidine kinase
MQKRIDEKIQITVKDNGAGIFQKIQVEIFQRFFVVQLPL